MLASSLWPKFWQFFCVNFGSGTDNSDKFIEFFDHAKNIGLWCGIEIWLVSEPSIGSINGRHMVTILDVVHLMTIMKNIPSYNFGCRSLDDDYEKHSILQFWMSFTWWRLWKTFHPTILDVIHLTTIMKNIPLYVSNYLTLFTNPFTWIMGEKEN